MKKLLYCEECSAEFTLNYKFDGEPQFCAFCGSEIIPDWNADEQLEDE